MAQPIVHHRTSAYEALFAQVRDGLKIIRQASEVEALALTVPDNGGVYLVHRFLSQLGFKDAVARHVFVPQRNNHYSVGEMLLALLYPMILGLERI